MPSPAADQLPFWIRCLYNVLLPVVLVLGLPGYLIKGLRRGGLGASLAERFGFLDAAKRARLVAGSGRRVWIHAVSVGETLVGLKVLRALRKLEPGAAFVFTTTTVTGYRLAEKELGTEAVLLFHPVDLPLVAGRMVRLIRPDLMVLIEAEIWPNLVQAVKRRGGRVVLANARLSERSERRFRAFGAFTRPLYGLLDLVAVQFAADRARFSRLGVPKDRIICPGSVKYDEAIAGQDAAKIEGLREWCESAGAGGPGPVLIGGSTHPGEETLLAKAWMRLRERHETLRLVLVPRHAERGAAVARELSALGIRPLLRVPVAAGGVAAPATGRESVAVVANTTGELRAWYALGTVVVIGKSLLGRGGQNPSEPLAAGVPVVVGPHMGNFGSLVEELREAGGLSTVANVDEGTAMETALASAVDELLGGDRESRREALVAAGAQVLARHHGASERTAAAFLSLLASPRREDGRE